MSIPLSLPRALLNAVHGSAVLDIVRHNAAVLAEPAASVLGTVCDLAAVTMDSDSDSDSMSEYNSDARISSMIDNFGFSLSLESNSECIPSPDAEVSSMTDNFGFNLISGLYVPHVPLNNNFDNGAGMRVSDVKTKNTHARIQREAVHDGTKQAKLEDGNSAQNTIRPEPAPVAETAASVDYAARDEAALSPVVPDKLECAARDPSDAIPLKNALDVFLGWCSPQNTTSETVQNFLLAHRKHIASGTKGKPVEMKVRYHSALQNEKSSFFLDKSAVITVAHALLTFFVCDD
jgi:hypothetical protein